MILFSDKVKHIREDHKKFYCDFCDYICDIRNKKRHLKTNHKGCTPANTLLINTNVKKCDECQKYFYCKSTLNRHMMRVHKKNSDKINCNKAYQNKSDKSNCDKSNENSKPNVTSHYISAKKQIQFKDNIEQLVEISFTKSNIHGKEKDITDMFKHVEKVVTIVTNRKQRVTTSVLIETVERMSKKTFDIHIFRILVLFKLYVELVDNDLEVSVDQLEMTPEVNNKRLETLHARIEEACQYQCIDLINFPEKHINKYQTAVEIIKENTFKIADSEEEMVN